LAAPLSPSLPLRALEWRRFLPLSPGAAWGVVSFFFFLFSFTRGNSGSSARATLFFPFLGSRATLGVTCSPFFFFFPSRGVVFFIAFFFECRMRSPLFFFLFRRGVLVSLLFSFYALAFFFSIGGDPASHQQAFPSLFFLSLSRRRPFSVVVLELFFRLRFSIQFPFFFFCPAVFSLKVNTRPSFAFGVFSSGFFLVLLVLRLDRTFLVEALPFSPPLFPAPPLPSGDAPPLLFPWDRPPWRGAFGPRLPFLPS